MNQLFHEALIVSILASTIRIMTPLLFSAMGELITQRAGIWNMGVEGTMLTGAFAAFARDKWRTLSRKFFSGLSICKLRERHCH